MKEGQGTAAKLLPRILVGLACCGSLVAYLVNSHGLRQLLESWPYHRMLLRDAFPTGKVLSSLPDHLPFDTLWPTTGEGLQLFVFAASCILAGWLCHSLLGRDLPVGPTLWLFSLGAAIVPPLLLGLVFFPDGRGMIRSDLLLGIGLFLDALLALLVWLRRRRAPSEAAPRSWRFSGWNAWTTAFLVPLVPLFGLAFLSGSVTVKGTDALAYHLPLAAAWYEEARLSFSYLVQSLLPSDAELLMRWTYVAGSDRYVFLVPFFAAILCLYMLYKVATAMGQSRSAALVSACCAATLPFFPNLAYVAYTDIAGTAFLLASVFFVLKWRDSACRRVALLACAGLAWGLSIGTKLSLLPAALVLVLLAAVAMWRSGALWLSPPLRLRMATRSRSLDWRYLGRSLLAFSLPAFLGCGYWLVRNFAVTGTPLFPVGFAGLAGYGTGEIVLIDPAYAGSLWSRLALPWNELSFASAYDDGLGAVFTGFALPALLFWLLLRSPRSRGGLPDGRDIVYGTVIGSLALFALSNTTMMRYGIFPLLLAFVFVGEIWTALRSRLFRGLIFAAYLLMTVLLAQSILGGHLYSRLYRDREGAARFSLPVQVDELAPSRIFNVTESFNTYGLMGRDFRHLVITLFRTSLPEDPEAFGADYVLLRDDQVPAFRAAAALSEVGRNEDGSLSLWRLETDRPRRPPTGLNDEEDVERMLGRILLRPWEDARKLDAGAAPTTP